jgi:ArsR family transcriptional regulator, zinc-responsive transcriptional repressor
MTLCVGVNESPLDRYDVVVDLFRVLASPVRVAIVDLLADQERLVHQLVEATGLTQPLVSQHLRVLRDARLVRRVRRGREMSYALRDAHVAHIVRDAIEHTKEEHIREEGQR